MNEKYPLALPEGTVLAGQYIIQRVLGQGGFGITYEAKDHKTGNRVAVKEFFPDAMATRTEHTTVSAYSGERGESFAYGKSCFLQEAETLAKFIGNENIVRIHSYFEENGTAYFVMDFIEGTSFDEYLRERGGKIPFDEAVRILVPVMDALSAVHSQGIVHRDVTPDNIYITQEGVVKLLDFGAARYSLGDKSRSLDIILKHGFAPKEQYTRRGRQGPYTDVYALGATFYFALTGKRPPDSVERMDEDDLVPPSSLGVEIGSAAEDAILQALSIQPADRFQSMMAFKNAMHISQQEMDGEPVLAAAGTTVSQTYFSAPDQSSIPHSSGIPRSESLRTSTPAPGQDADLQDLAATKKTAGKLAGKLAGKMAGQLAEKTAETAGVVAGTAGKMTEIMAAKKAETAERLAARAAKSREAAGPVGNTVAGAPDGTVGATVGDTGAYAAGMAAGSAPANQKSKAKLLIPAVVVVCLVVVVFLFLGGAKNVTDMRYTCSGLGISGTYTGKWKDDQPYEEGTVKWDNGNTYEGKWENGMPNGWGTCTFYTGDVSTGTWVDGVLNGNGSCTYANGDYYAGAWQNGYPNGHGQYTWADDGRVYDGEWKDGVVNGQGTMDYANGDKYIGEWVNGYMHGEGNYFFANGDKYLGQFQDGAIRGAGTYITADGQETYNSNWS